MHMCTGYLIIHCSFMNLIPNSLLLRISTILDSIVSACCSTDACTWSECLCVLLIRNLFNDTDDSNVSTLRNVYNGNGHHEYDTIPDVLEQMQLRQMEMVS